MTPAETIQAAIDKLESQSAVSRTTVIGRWANDEEDSGEVTGSHGSVGEFWHVANADLVVTLHRTIDAQLAVLDRGLSDDETDDQGGWHDSEALMLARAILGETA